MKNFFYRNEESVFYVVVIFIFFLISLFAVQKCEETRHKEVIMEQEIRRLQVKECPCLSFPACQCFNYGKEGVNKCTK